MFILWWEHLRFTLIAIFKYTVLLTIATMLYIRSLELIHLTIETLYPLADIFPTPYSLITINLLFISMTSILLDSSISETIQYLSFSVLFISLSIMPSRFTHVVTNGKIFSDWLIFHAVIYIYIYIHTHSNTHFLYPFIHWWTLSLLSCHGHCK